MELTCTECGAELYPGQKFCRVCGRSTAGLGVGAGRGVSTGPSGEAPTQNMPLPQPSAPDPAHGSDFGYQYQAPTAPQDRPTTAPVYPTQPPPVYPPPVPGYYQAVYPQRSRSGGSAWGWIITFGGIGIFGLVFLVILFAARNRHRTTPPPKPPQGASTYKAADLPWDNETIIGGSETAFTKRVPFSSDAVLTINNLSGDVKIDAWDDDQAEIKIVEKGGSPDSRRTAAANSFKSDANGVSLIAPPTNISAAYEIKLPKYIKKVHISSKNGNATVTGVNADMDIDLTNGSIVLQAVGGTATARTVNGNIRAEFVDLDEGSLSFESTSGNVEVSTPSDLNAELSARTISGNVDIDPDFGVSVDKGVVGQSAHGTIGTGGRSLTLKSTSGNVKLTATSQ